MITLFMKLTLLISITYLICLPLQTFADSKLREYKNNILTDWSDIYHSKINADLIIQGSSRAWGGVSPKAIEAAYGINSYNLAIIGYDILMQWYRFKIYLMYNKAPKYIIQVLDINTLKKRDDLCYPEQFFAYLEDDNIKEAVSNYEGFSILDYYVPLLKYSKSRNIKLYEVLFKKLPSTDDKYKGFWAQDWAWDGTFDKFKKDNPNGITHILNDKSIHFFEEFLSYCQRNNIKVILVYLPEYIEGQFLANNRRQIMLKYVSYAKKYNIPLIDYSNSDISLDKTCFYNSTHMNSKGSNRLNQQLMKDLTPYIN